MIFMRYLMIYASFLLLIGCGRNTYKQRPLQWQLPFDTAAVVEEGREITQAAFRTLGSNLQQAMKEGGVEHALQFCSVEAIPLTDSLSARFSVKVGRASHRPRNPDNRADSLELVSIRNYLQQIEAGEKLSPAVYAAEQGLIFHAPIRIPGELCLNCHGQPGTDITGSNLELIRTLYPEDEATGFATGELRGIWTVRFPFNYFERNGTKD